MLLRSKFKILNSNSDFQGNIWQRVIISILIYTLSDYAITENILEIFRLNGSYLGL